MTDIKTDSLRKIPLFAVVEGACAAALAEAAQLRNYAAGETVFEEGSVGDAVYFLLSGEMVIEKQIDNGKFKPLAILGEGEFFGEMAILSGVLSPRSARARAVSKVLLAEISGLRLLKIINTDTKSGMAFMRAMLAATSGRLRKTSGELAMVYDIGALAFAEFGEERLFAKKLLDEAMPHLEGRWSGAFYIYDQFNEELAIAALKGENFKPPRDFSVIGGNLPNFWDGDTYVVVLPGSARPDGFIVFASQDKLSARDKSALAVSLSAVGCMADSILANIRHINENKMREMLLSRKLNRG